MSQDSDSFSFPPKRRNRAELLDRMREYRADLVQAVSPMLFFVVLNYAISWGFIYPAFAALKQAPSNAVPPIAYLGLIGQYGPSIAAIVVVGFYFGRQELRQLMKKFIAWRAPVFWYAIAILLPLGISLLAVIGSTLFGFSLGSASFPQPILLLPLSLLAALPFGPLGEELGWRGFMLPGLLTKHGWFVGSLILGVVWTLWHLASFAYPGAAIASYFTVNVFTIILFFLEILLHAIIFTIFFIKTRGNLLVAILLHAAFNASSDMALSIFPSIANHSAHLQAIYYIYLLVTGLALAILIFCNRKALNAK